ncbi:MAG: gamma-glutamyltransferase, partial [Planctomycetes bacterium]|nr:gamma-glutamyltransferase [Planctomycetota bacterium]
VIPGGTYSPGEGGTTTCVVADRWGNLVAATPSANGPYAVCPELGVAHGNRLRSMNTTAGHPNRIEPGKRPRITLTPTLVTKEGRGVIGIEVNVALLALFALNTPQPHPRCSEQSYPSNTTGSGASFLPVDRNGRGTACGSPASMAGTSNGCPAGTLPDSPSSTPSIAITTSRTGPPAAKSNWR